MVLAALGRAVTSSKCGGPAFTFKGGHVWSAGDKAWLALGTGIVAYELLGSELLSVAYDKYVNRFPVLARVLPLILTLHVINAYPQKYDPIHLVFGFGVSLWGKCFDRRD